MTALRPTVLMLTTQLGYGGAETSFIRLANYLSQSMEITVALFTSTYGGTAYAQGHEPLHAKVTLLDTTPHGRLQRWWRRVKQLRALKAEHDVCISFLSGPNLVNALSGYPLRSVVSVRGSRMYDPVAGLLQRMLFQHLIDPVVYRLVGRIVPVSAGLVHEVRQIAGEKAARKARIISPFIDATSVQQRLSTPAPDHYTALKGQKVIIAAGRLSIEKGFHHLIRIFAEVSKIEPGAKLVLIGDGPLRDALRSQCEALQLPMDDVTAGTASVIFTGYQREVLPLMALGRVFVLSSATEGFPNVILEAMSAGLSIVAADTPWGARAILAPETANAADPYPTKQAHATSYGTLMPRIDQAVYQAAWTNQLVAQLRTPQPIVQRRTQDFDVSIVGEQWKALIRETIDQSKVQP